MTLPDIAETVLETHFGRFSFSCFKWGPHEEDNVLVVHRSSTDPVPLVRVQSACYTAEIFRSKDCDCHAQLAFSLRRISDEGGYLVYMICDGRGAGLFDKVRGLELGRTRGLDTAEAYSELGLPLDPRSYERVASVLNHFGVKRCRLLTNNPRKIQGLIDHGIEVSRVALEVPATPESRPYLKAKRFKLGHMMTQFDGDGSQEGDNVR